MPRGERIVIRLSIEEKGMLEARAETDQRPLSQWVRMQLGVGAVPGMMEAGDRVGRVVLPTSRARGNLSKPAIPDVGKVEGPMVLATKVVTVDEARKAYPEPSPVRCSKHKQVQCGRCGG